MTAEADGGRRRVVVIGAGFGGLTVARELRRANADVTLVDRTNHHLFQPLLYQVAAGGLSEGDCASAIRGHLRRQANASVLMAEVTDLDVEARRVILDRAEPLDYDSLVVACGAETSYFGHDEWAEASFGLKTLRDAIALRERIVSAFEEAERASDRNPTGRIDDLRGRRRRAHGGRDRRPARNPRPRRPEAPVLADRHHDGSRDPHRRGRSGRAGLQREALGEGRERPG